VGINPAVRPPWQDLSDVEFATLEYIDWFYNRRLHGEFVSGPGFTTPAALEADCYLSANIPADPVATPNPE
jgi:hypothetical protein